MTAYGMWNGNSCHYMSNTKWWITDTAVGWMWGRSLVLFVTVYTVSLCVCECAHLTDTVLGAESDSFNCFRSDDPCVCLSPRWHAGSRSSVIPRNKQQIDWRLMLRTARNLGEIFWLFNMQISMKAHKHLISKLPSGGFVLSVTSHCIGWKFV